MLFSLFLTQAFGATPQDLSTSMAIDPVDLVNASLTADSLAVDVMSNLGIVTPTEGSDFAMLYTGAIGSPPQTGTDLGSWGETGDRVTFTVDLYAPAGANSARFDFFFLSAEYPEYVGTQFNDKFEANISSSAYTGNAAIDNQGNQISVNSVFFSVVDAPSLQGTGFDIADYSGLPAGGGTGWLTIMVPVAPEENVSFSFVIYDVADGIYDSAVLLDNFSWSELEIDEPSIVIPVGIDYLSPKRSTTAGGITTTVYGENFNAGCEVTFDGIPALSTNFLDATRIQAEVPPHEVGLVDVNVNCMDSDDNLVGGFTYYEDNDGDAPPAITYIDPHQVSEVGGESVTVYGEGFVSGSIVLVDDVEASSSFVDANTINLTTPAHDVGFANVKVSNPDGLWGDLAGGLYYVPIPPDPDNLAEEDDGRDEGEEADSEDEALEGDKDNSVGACSSAAGGHLTWIGLFVVALLIRRKEQ